MIACGRCGRRHRPVDEGTVRRYAVRYRYEVESALIDALARQPGQCVPCLRLDPDVQEALRASTAWPDARNQADNYQQSRHPSPWWENAIRNLEDHRE